MKGKLMNFNLVHNILNILIVALIASMIASGCTADATGAVAECSQSFIPEWISKWLILGAAGGKVVLNLIRDGLGGLYKQQPKIPQSPPST
jgi:hypothetical protein